MPQGAVAPEQAGGVDHLVRDPDRLEGALDLVNGALGTPFSVASRIEDGRFQIVGLADDLNTGFEVGAEFDSADSFCVRIANTGVAECVPVVANDDQLSTTYPHVTLGLETYLGIPIVVDGSFYGTLAVCDIKPREFSEREQARANAGAELAASALRLPGDGASENGGFENENDAQTE